MEPEPAGADENDDRSLAEASQRELTIGGGCRLGTFRSIPGLEDAGACDSLTLAVDDPAADCAQGSLQQWRQGMRLFLDCDPIGENRI